MGNLFEIILLALTWCGFSNDFSWPTIVFGAIIASVIVVLTNRYKMIKFGVNPIILVQLLIITFYELIKSSVEVALEVLSISHNSHPVIINIPLACENNFQKTVLASLVSLTPGTLSFNYVDNTLSVHAMFARNSTKLFKFIKEVLEPKVMRAFYAK